MYPSLGFGGLNRSIAPGLLPFFLVKLATGINSGNSVSPEPAAREEVTIVFGAN